MWHKLIATALFLCVGMSPVFGAEALKKIRIASKGAGETLLPYVISQRLGFYREEGLDVDAIVTRGTVTTQVVDAPESHGRTVRRFGAGRPPFSTAVTIPS